MNPSPFSNTNAIQKQYFNTKRKACIRITVFGSYALDPAWGGVVSLIDSSDTNIDNALNTIFSFIPVENLTMRASKEMRPLGTSPILADWAYAHVGGCGLC